MPRPPGSSASRFLSRASSDKPSPCIDELSKSGGIGDGHGQLWMSKHAERLDSRHFLAEGQQHTPAAIASECDPEVRYAETRRPCDLEEFVRACDPGSTDVRQTRGYSPAPKMRVEAFIAHVDPGERRCDPEQSAGAPVPRRPSERETPRVRWLIFGRRVETRGDVYPLP